MRTWLILPFAVFAGAAVAQTGSGITVPVSRSVSLMPDEAAFTINLSASLNSNTQQVKQALQGAGLPNPTVVASGLSADNNVPPSSPQLRYLALITIPAASARDAAKGLETLRTHLTPPLSSLDYSAVLQASQTARDAAWQTALPGMLADARKQAQAIADNTAVTLGAIRAIGDSAGGAQGYIAASVSLRTGDFSQLLAGYPSAPSPYAIYLNVTFDTAP